MGIEKGLSNHPAVVETQLSLLHSINDRLGSLCDEGSGEDVPRLQMRDLLSDLSYALDEDRREMDVDEEETTGGVLRAMDQD